MRTFSASLSVGFTAKRNCVCSIIIDQVKVIFFHLCDDNDKRVFPHMVMFLWLQCFLAVFPLLIHLMYAQAITTLYGSYNNNNNNKLNDS